MVKMGFLFVGISLTASAAGFSLTIGPPVAAGPGGQTVTKKIGSLFAVRLEECPDPSSAHVSAAAISGLQRPVTVQLASAGTPGVYLVSTPYTVIEGPPLNFIWMVSISATCGNETAGAIVPVRSLSFERDYVKLLPHAPTTTEIQQALSDAEKRAIVRPQ